ncbi:MAG: SDR family oxidoreductase [Mycobacterium sp.]
MDVLVAGADSQLGRTVAEACRAAGHQVVVSGMRRDELELVAKELDVDAIVCDPTDPAGLAEAKLRFPQHLDTIISVPVPAGLDGDPRAYNLGETAAAWRSAFDRIVIAAVLTVQAAGDNLRSGGSIVTVVPDSATDSGPEGAAKSALANWTAGVADHFGTRGITINTVACGRATLPGYDGLGGHAPQTNDEIARLALFLTTPAARHITGQTLHVGRGAAVAFR